MGRLISAGFALGVLASGCGGSDGMVSSDLGAQPDLHVQVDLGVDGGPDPDLGPTPTACSQLPGLYVAGSCSVLSAGVRAYRPQFELWSDGADKERFVFIPEGGVIDTSDPDRWVYPAGTTFWKTFSRNGLRLETRILTKRFAGEGADVWRFETYLWNQTQDDVTVVSNDGLEDVLGTTHDIPSRRDCLECHADQARDVSLGFSAIQLASADLPLTLDDLAAAAEVSNAIPMASAAVPGTEAQRSALGYLHGNCAGCHGGPSPARNLSLQIQVGVDRVCNTSTYVTALGAYVDKAGTCQTPGLPVAWVTPNDIAGSLVYEVMNVRDGEQMPPVGTEVTDADGLTLIERWIRGGVPDTDDF